MIIEVAEKARSWGLSVWGSSNAPDYVGTASNVREQLKNDPQYRANGNLSQCPAVFFKGRKVKKAFDSQGNEITHPNEIRQFLEWIRSVEVADA